MNPAHRIIAKCGGGDFKRGVVIVSEITGVHSSRVHRWTYPEDRGGTGGIIPTRHQQTILDSAIERGVALKPSDFFEKPEDAESPPPRRAPESARRRAGVRT